MPTTTKPSEDEIKAEIQRRERFVRELEGILPDNVVSRLARVELEVFKLQIGLIGLTTTLEKLTTIVGNLTGASK